MKKILLISIVISGFIPLFGQQVSQVNHYWLDNTRVNPGAAGNMDMVNISGIIRQLSFVGFPGAPKSLILNADAPFNLFNKKHGVSLNVMQDIYGFNSDINFSFSYAYRPKLGDGHLGIGIGVEGMNVTIDPEWVYPSGSGNEGTLTVPQGGSDGGEFGVNMSLGMFYRSEDIYFGLSAKNIFSPKPLKYNSNTTGVGEPDFEILMKPHYYATAGYTMTLSNPSFEYVPSLLIESDITTVKLDINNSIIYNKNIWGGVTYRHGAAIIGMFGLTIYEDIKISYAYEFQTSALNNYSGGTHEFVLNYSFKVISDKEPKKYRSIRYL